MTRLPWNELSAAVPRAQFIPDVIWVSDGEGGFVALSRHDDLAGWQAAVQANRFVVTQVDDGHTPPGGKGQTPTSSCSMPSVVAAMLAALGPQPGHRVLEIGTGTGWNAALLARLVGDRGHVVTVEVDPDIAEYARVRLRDHGPLVVTGDGARGHPPAAPYDRVIATASIRETVPWPWIQQLRPGGRLIAPWGTNWCNGFQLTATRTPGGLTGRFSGDLVFMRMRAQRRTCWEPSDDEIQQAVTSTTVCNGVDLDRMRNPTLGLFAIGAKLDHICAHTYWNTLGRYHHLLEFDDAATRSWARLDADLNGTEPNTVLELGPRRLWDEIEAAYDWWHETGEPGMDRFGLEAAGGRQWLWLDEPDHTVRVLTEA
ncbi:methyltransferase domain-containing protein [Longimycelium tulufanense]|nr:methyltransferase domain-containing protein [Longimycelium tulufanense]